MSTWKELKKDLVLTQEDLNAIELEKELIRTNDPYKRGKRAYTIPIGRNVQRQTARYRQNGILCPFSSNRQPAENSDPFRLYLTDCPNEEKIIIYSLQKYALKNSGAKNPPHCQSRTLGGENLT